MRWFLLFAFAALASLLAQQKPNTRFEAVRPILEKRCLACHGERGAGGLRLLTRAQLMRGGFHGPVIVTGKPEASLFLQTLEMKPGSSPLAMPPGMQLPAAERETIRAWIADGAPWPDNISLGTKSPANAEADLVTRLWKRISSNTAFASGAYKERIPGTDVTFDVAPIPAGEFLMGSPGNETGRREDEGPQRRVTVEAFWMQAREVTWNEYRLFQFEEAAELANIDPLVDGVSRPTKPYVEMSFGMGTDGFPAISMTQHAANKYAQWLSAKTGRFYRLPTEAEWEYACRAGETAAPDEKQLADVAWYTRNSNEKYQLVGAKKPNRWGLYDMLGNVAEWTLDQYAPYAPGNATSPWVKASQPYPHSVRGGGWADEPGSCRCAARNSSDPSWKMQDPQLPKSIWYMTDAQWLGFRLVRPVKTPSAKQMQAYWNSGVERD
jgi:formylglycine-generating enzyme required for sulfatase activity